MGSNLKSENGQIIFTVDDNTCNAMLNVLTLMCIHELSTLHGAPIFRQVFANT